MAVYPEGNPGAYPVDPASDVGQFRLLSGDVTADPYNPVVPGFRNFEKFSDAEIDAYLAQGGGSVNRAIGYSYLFLSGQAAIEAKQIKDYDLQVDTTKRAADLRATAQIWFGMADNDDIASAEEGFEIVPTGARGAGFIPEGALPQWGRQYTWGRWR